ncbi:HAMP domain-containing histidine kinase, partial [candidate division WOR-3 bacterium]|nr:HAMP domain-containing histidine kinase [candidate division WOR-3 bacterium]
IPFDRMAVAFHNEETGFVTQRWVRSETAAAHVATGYWAELRGSSLEPVLRTGRPRIINNLEHYLAAHPDSRNTREVLQDGVLSSLTCPLRAAGRAIGFLFFSSSRPDSYHDSHITVFEKVAEALNLAVEKVKYIDDLEQARRNYAQILYFVAHELKSPLSSVVTVGQTLTNGYLGPLTPAQAERVERMIENSNYLLNLVRDYLDLSQIESGEMKYRPQPAVDLVEQVVRPMLGIHLPPARDRGMEIHTDLEYLTAPGDPDLLKVVVGNLLGNAVKYGREAGHIWVSLVRRAFSDYDDAGRRRRAWYAYFSVRNEGAGFTLDQKQQLFARFQRLNQPALRAARGSGLGLYISRQIVLRHGGEISADSQPGIWAEFHFRIPLKQEPSLADVPA